MKLTDSNGQILAQHNGNYGDSRYFYLHDRLGSVRLVIDSSANVKNRYIYQPFGEAFTAETEETIGNPFRFTGQWYDAEIGEYFLRARMFDPHINRFTSRDPVFGKFEQPLTLHKYLYCVNDPINRWDPQGLWTFHISGTAFVSFGWSVVRQSGIVIDDDGNVGWMNVTGIGGGTPAASIGATFGWTNADTIFDLEGIGCAAGGSLFFGGAEYVFGNQRNGNIYQGFDVSFGKTISPAYSAEIHTHITKTKIYQSDLNWREVLGQIHQALNESIYEVGTVGQGYSLLWLWDRMDIE